MVRGRREEGDVKRTQEDTTQWIVTEYSHEGRERLERSPRTLRRCHAAAHHNARKRHLAVPSDIHTESN